MPVSARWLSAKARLPGTAVITHDQSCGQQCRSSSATPVCQSGTLRVLYAVLYGVLYGKLRSVAPQAKSRCIRCRPSLVLRREKPIDRLRSCHADLDGLTSRTVPLSRRTQSERRVRL